MLDCLVYPSHRGKLYSKFGFKDFIQIAFVVVLAPYVIIIMAAIFNNVMLTFL